jgi:hypothetical protein
MRENSQDAAQSSRSVLMAVTIPGAHRRAPPAASVRRHRPWIDASLYAFVIWRASPTLEHFILASGNSSDSRLSMEVDGGGARKRVCFEGPVIFSGASPG